MGGDGTEPPTWQVWARFLLVAVVVIGFLALVGYGVSWAVGWFVSCLVI